MIAPGSRSKHERQGQESRAAHARATRPILHASSGEPFVVDHEERLVLPFNQFPWMNGGFRDQLGRRGTEESGALRSFGPLSEDKCPTPTFHWTSPSQQALVSSANRGPEPEPQP
jgi:hypothetical protein